MSEIPKSLKWGQLGWNVGSKAKELARLSIMYYKLNELAMSVESLEKIYVIEIKIVSLS